MKVTELLAAPPEERQTATNTDSSIINEMMYLAPPLVSYRGNLGDLTGVPLTFISTHLLLYNLLRIPSLPLTSNTQDGKQVFLLSPLPTRELLCSTDDGTKDTSGRCTACCA